MSKSPMLNRQQLRAVHVAMRYLMADIETMSTEDDRERYREALLGYNTIARLVAAASPCSPRRKPPRDTTNTQNGETR
jgi:hypothetical protein